MTELPNETELLIAAYRWQAGGKDDIGRLASAVQLEVKGPLYEQLRIGCERALKAPESRMKLAREAIGALIRDIGEDEQRRRKAGGRHGAQTRPARSDAHPITPRPPLKIRDPSTGELFDLGVAAD